MIAITVSFLSGVFISVGLIKLVKALSELNNLETLSAENVELRGRIVELEGIVEALQTHLKKTS